MATDYSDELMEEMGRLQEELDHADAWDLDSKLEQAMDALRCPPPDADVDPLSGGERRRVALCKLLLRAARPAAARRAHQPPRRRERAVAGAAPGQVPGHRHGDHPRPVLPRQRRRVDPRARPRPRATRYEGNYSTYLEKKAAAAGRCRAARTPSCKKRLADELEWVRSNAKARQTKSRARLDRYEEMAAEAEKTRKLDFEEIQIPPGPRLGNMVIEADEPAQGLRRPGADRRPVVLAAAQRHRRHHRPERRRQDHAVQDASSGWRSPTRGAVRVGETVTAVLRGPEPGRPGRQARRSGRSSPTAWTT